MAFASAVTTKTVVQVAITLDREEFEALAVVLNNVGGHGLKRPDENLSERSARGAIDSIISALRQAGCPTGTEVKRSNPKRYETAGGVFFAYPRFKPAKEGRPGGYYENE